MNRLSPPILRVAVWLAIVASATPIVAKSESPSELAASAKEILRANCSECHSNEDARADVRVLDHAGLIESEHIVPNKPDDSYLYQLITSTDDDAMPPKSRPTLTAEQIGTIRKWITSGAEAFPADAVPVPSVEPDEASVPSPSDSVATDSSSTKRRR